MITKCSTSPNAVTCEEARYLGDESWLGGHDLIGGYTVAWKYMLQVLEGECLSISSPTIKIQLECRSNRSPEGILGDLEVCSAINRSFY
jgi:hypothetical protein